MYKVFTFKSKDLYRGSSFGAGTLEAAEGYMI